MEVASELVLPCRPGPEDIPHLTTENRISRLRLIENLILGTAGQALPHLEFMHAAGFPQAQINMISVQVTLAKTSHKGDGKPRVSED
jgi:hypothetical protein